MLLRCCCTHGSVALRRRDGALPCLTLPASARLAPEVLFGGVDCTLAVDLFSFGILLWEIFTGAPLHLAGSTGGTRMPVCLKCAGGGAWLPGGNVQLVAGAHVAAGCNGSNRSCCCLWHTLLLFGSEPTRA